MMSDRRTFLKSLIALPFLQGRGAGGEAVGRLLPMKLGRSRINSPETNLPIGQAFDLGQLAIYENIEMIPDVEITVNGLCPTTIPQPLIEDALACGYELRDGRLVNSYMDELVSKVYSDSIEVDALFDPVDENSRPNNLSVPALPAPLTFDEPCPYTVTTVMLASPSSRLISRFETTPSRLV